MKRIVGWSILLGLLLMVLAASSAFGCAPEDGEPPVRCIPTARLRAEPTPIVLAIPAPEHILPSGLNPDSAIEPTGAWQFIDPNATVWYKMTDARMQLVVWVDANGENGIALAIFAPDQHDLYGTPIGRGSPHKLEAHDLFWTGRSIAYGTWFARVTNNSSIPISYSLNYERRSTRKADACAVCHGYGIEFDGCEDAPGGSWCGSLEEEYKR